MLLSQFKLKKSFRQDVLKESKKIYLTKNKSVQLFELEKDKFRVVKKVDNETVFNVVFTNKKELEKCLKNISKI